MKKEENVDMFSGIILKTCFSRLIIKMFFQFKLHSTYEKLITNSPK